MMTEEALEAAKRSIEIEAEAISDVARYMDWDSLSRAVDAVAIAERTITCACGHSGIAAMKLAHSLCCIERPAKFMSPAEAVHGGLGCVQRGDAVVMVSRGGKTAELMPIIRVVKEKKAILIGVTENMSSTLAIQSDIVLPMRIQRESDKNNLMSTSSFVATIAIFDALFCALMEETGFDMKKFALIHPGGAAGELLNPRHIPIKTKGDGGQRRYDGCFNETEND